MAYATLNVVPNRGGARNNTSRAKATEFVDGYKQEVIVGLHKSTSTVPFAFSGTYQECFDIEAFFLAAIGTAFYFRFMPQEPLRLYKVGTEFPLQHDGGLRWTISATFEQYIGF